MYELLLIAALAIVPQSPVVRDSVERLELNHKYDLQGQLTFTQVIGWQATNRVRFWRMASKEPALIPARDYRLGGYVLTFTDGEVVRQIRAPSFAETWTQDGGVGDPEVNDRALLPDACRQPLKPPNHFWKGR